MSKIKKNDLVSIEYEVREKGKDELIDSNKGTNEPLEFVIGAMQVVPGLDEAIEAASVGDSIHVEVPPEKGYGMRREDFVQTVPRSEFEGIELEKGMTLYGQAEDGQTVQVTVLDFDSNAVTIDYNHPLAGITLIFDVDIKSAREASSEELLMASPAPKEGGCCGGKDGGGCGCH